VGRHSQLQRKRYAGQAGEHLSVPPVNAASPAADLRPRKWLRGLYACISMLCVRPGGRLAKSGRRSSADVAAAAGMRHREETLTPSRLNGHHPHSVQLSLASADAAA
jgi:hypothetical protein